MPTRRRRVSPSAQLQHQLVLRPSPCPGQLDRMSLVYQLEGKELHFAEYHRWAGFPMPSLNQLTLNGLSSRLPGLAGWCVRTGPARACAEPSRRAFPGRHDGRALLASGRWRLLTEGRVERCFPSSRSGCCLPMGMGPGERAGGLATVARSDCGGCAHAHLRKHKKTGGHGLPFCLGSSLLLRRRDACTLTSTRRSGARQRSARA